MTSPRKLPIFLVEDELHSLLRAPAAAAADAAAAARRPRRRDYRHMALRDTAMLATLVYTGVRLKELVGLDLCHIEPTRGTIRVLGKGARERLIPLNPHLRESLDAWLHVRPTCQSKAVFLSRYDRRVSPRAVQLMLAKYIRVAGIEREHVSPHKLRHTFATLLHRAGVDILRIQALLGHSSITSTRIYTHTDTTDLQSAVDALPAF